MYVVRLTVLSSVLAAYGGVGVPTDGLERGIIRHMKMKIFLLQMPKLTVTVKVSWQTPPSVSVVAPVPSRENVSKSRRSQHTAAS